MTYLHGETVVRHRAPGAVDAYSAEATELDWSSEVDTAFTGISVAPGPSFESAEAGRTRLDIDFTLYGPSGWDIKPVDEVTVRGHRCTVEGLAGDWSSPYTGRQPGSVVEVRRVAG